MIYSFPTYPEGACAVCKESIVLDANIVGLMYLNGEEVGYNILGGEMAVEADKIGVVPFHTSCLMGITQLPDDFMDILKTLRSRLEADF